MKNAKYLRIASILFIVLGIASVLLVLGVLNAPQFLAVVEENGETVLKDLVLNYAIVAIEIVAGIVGLIFAGKKSAVTVLFGVICFVVQVWITHNSTSTGVVSFIVNAICFIPSVMYLAAAYNTFAGND